MIISDALTAYRTYARAEGRDSTIQASVIPSLVFGTIRLLTLQAGMVYRSQQKGGQPDASVLCEMPRQEGDKESEGSYPEEQKACDTGCMSGVWDKDVQNW